MSETRGERRGKRITAMTLPSVWREDQELADAGADMVRIMEELVPRHIAHRGVPLLLATCDFLKPEPEKVCQPWGAKTHTHTHNKPRKQLGPYK